MVLGIGSAVAVYPYADLSVPRSMRISCMLHMLHHRMVRRYTRTVRSLESFPWLHGGSCCAPLATRWVQQFDISTGKHMPQPRVCYKDIGSKAGSTAKEANRRSKASSVCSLECVHGAAQILWCHQPCQLWPCNACNSLAAQWTSFVYSFTPHCCGNQDCCANPAGQDKTL